MMPSRFQVSGYQLQCCRVDWKVANFAAFTPDSHARSGTVGLRKVLHLQSGEFFTSQSMVEEDRKNRPVPLAFERVRQRSLQKLARLGIGEGRCFSNLGLNPRAFDTFHRIVGDGVLMAQIFKQGGEGGELSANGGAGELLLFQIGAPGQDVRSLW